jgi:hypothetical protein
MSLSIGFSVIFYLSYFKADFFLSPPYGEKGYYFNFITNPVSSSIQTIFLLLTGLRPRSNFAPNVGKIGGLKEGGNSIAIIISKSMPETETYTLK